MRESSCVIRLSELPSQEEELGLGGGQSPPVVEERSRASRIEMSVVYDPEDSDVRARSDDFHRRGEILRR
jgi:hypothetical protein